MSYNSVQYNDNTGTVTLKYYDKNKGTTNFEWYNPSTTSSDYITYTNGTTGMSIYSKPFQFSYSNLADSAYAVEENLTNFKWFNLNGPRAVILSTFQSSTSFKRVQGIIKTLNYDWVMPKTDEVEISFDKPVTASQIFEIGKMKFKDEDLIFEDADFTFNYYLALIGDFLNNFVVLKPYPSKVIKDYESKFLKSIPVGIDEYKNLNFLAYLKPTYPASSGEVIYLCDRRDLETVKSLLKSEVEKTEKFLGKEENKGQKDMIQDFKYHKNGYY